MKTNSPNQVDGDVLALKFRAEAAEAKLNLCRSVLYSLAFVARRILPDYDEHPEIQRADEILDDDSFINTPPAQLLRPLELPDIRRFCSSHINCKRANEFLSEALRKQGCEVKND